MVLFTFSSSYFNFPLLGWSAFLTTQADYHTIFILHPAEVLPSQLPASSLCPCRLRLVLGYIYLVVQSPTRDSAQIDTNIKLLKNELSDVPVVLKSYTLPPIWINSTSDETYAT